MTIRINRAQRRAIQKVSKSTGANWSKEQVDRICDGLEREVFNSPNGYQRKPQQETTND